ncbi:hypothetical protein GFL09_13155 [Pseudomonas stutzeri]|uniref:DUF6088 family protein n=1 Tax=Stutzerimonas stutzeri TaxID=316 RepID=A0ABD4Y4L2_STUST|nr:MULTISPECIES: DUF6088 family protein [Stutzerimonas stutzeri group]MBK3868628.1 hypothetical protein [Stutzerimonas stutzeri]MDH0689863.1 DUF6088 family protein [Stutzerimonas stutzeri]TVT62925.1 MAG: hypothetical protein FHK79_21500 [Pseudomonas sp.]
MSVAQATSNRVKRMKKGTLFVRKAFAEVGSRAAVDEALFRLVQSGCLKRVARGVYVPGRSLDVPEMNPHRRVYAAVCCGRYVQYTAQIFSSNSSKSYRARQGSHYAARGLSAAGRSQH